MGEDGYQSEDGYCMRREHGTSPNGNKIGGRWLLRGPAGEWMGHDQYRHDLAPRFGFVIEDGALKRATPAPTTGEKP